MEFIKDDETKKLIGKMEYTKKSFYQLYPMIKRKEAIDLLYKMLVFNPQKRYDARECLMHPYFDGIRDQDFDSIPTKAFDWEFDDIELEKKLIQKLIYKETLLFHPDSPTSTTSTETNSIIANGKTEEKNSTEITNEEDKSETKVKIARVQEIVEKTSDKTDKSNKINKIEEIPKENKIEKTQQKENIDKEVRV